MSESLSARCGGCRHFDDDARTLESEIAGLVVMGSAYASVRAGDGLCRLHRRYLSSTSRCDAFEARSQQTATA
ncbi:MAG: hypothetical protein ABI843_02275 [Dokdonella sp.]